MGSQTLRVMLILSIIWRLILIFIITSRHLLTNEFVCEKFSKGMFSNDCEEIKNVVDI